MSAEPVLDGVGFATFKSLDVRVRAPLPVLRVDTFDPAIAELGLHRSAREVQPALIDVRAETVRITQPDHCRGCVCEEAEALFALMQRSNVLHHSDDHR